MPNSQYERDFNEGGALKRPGRLDFRLLNNEDDAGDGYPGLQKMIRNLIHQFHNRFVLDGCTYNGVDTLSSGTIIWDNDIVTVAEQTITVNNSEFLYIDSTGTAQTTAVEATAEAAVMVYYRDSGGTGEDIIFKYYQNNLEVYKLVIHKEFDANGKFIVNLGYPTLDEHAATKKYVDDFISSWAIMVDTTDSIQTAIDTITALGGGYIYLERGTHNDSVNTFPISIDDAGVSITIFGDGYATEIDPNGDVVVFDILEGETTTLKDFRIDANDFASITRAAIYINNTSDGEVVIDNVDIDGDGTNGRFLDIRSSNVTVKNCKITDGYNGIYISNCTNTRIIDNEIESCTDFGILTSSNNILFVERNLIYSCGGPAIYAANGSKYHINDNYIVSNTKSAINFTTAVNDSFVTNNYIYNNDSNDGVTYAAIDLAVNCDRVNISNNVINGNNNTGAGNTYAIWLQIGCDDCNVYGNTCWNNDSDICVTGGTTPGLDVNGLSIHNIGRLYGYSTVDISVYSDLLMQSADIDVNGNTVDMGSGIIADVASIDGYSGNAIIINDDLDISNNNLDDVASIDGGGDAVVFNDNLDMSGNDLDMGNGNIDDVASIDGGGNAIDINDDIDMNSNEIQNAIGLNYGQPPMHIFGDGGFSQVDFGWSVAANDTDADVYATFLVPETRSDWRVYVGAYVTGFASTNTTNTDIYIGAATDNEAPSSDNLINGDSMDFTFLFNRYDLQNSNAFSASKNDILRFRLNKNADESGDYTNFVITTIVLYHP